MADYKIAIIGTGNVATNLALALEEAGHFITEIYGRDLTLAMDLANRLYETEAVDYLDFSESEAGIFFLCISDSAIESVAQNLVLPANAIVVHTSGSMSIQLLATTASYYGVFYPIQTFSKTRIISLGEVPICLESSDGDVREVLVDLASSLSNFVYELNSEERKVAHLAAVFINNFGNHLISLATDIAKEADVPFDLFNALILETAQKAVDIGSDMAQTGPAKRNDENTIITHQSMLSNQPYSATIYRLLSESIQNRFPKNE